MIIELKECGRRRGHGGVVAGSGSLEMSRPWSSEVGFSYPVTSFVVVELLGELVRRGAW